MIIREATEADIPEIVLLLKSSLGESLLPKSEAYWRWKHVNNPFGKSEVLVAEEDSIMVGVRAFMNWTWEAEAHKIYAVRAVDTATRSSFQGKGIFTKLTMSLIKKCENGKSTLIYNTPNEKSMPGYLKMGWNKAGQLPVEVKITRPVSMALHALNKWNRLPVVHDNSVADLTSHSGLSELLQKHQARSNVNFRTAYSLPYLKWRYYDIPVVKYFAAGVEQTRELKSAFFYRLKPTRLGMELRITDLFLAYGNDIRSTRNLVIEKARAHKADFISITANNDNKLLNGLLHYRSSKIGPMVTVRDITSNVAEKFIGFKKWSPSMGDMELF
jgi:hypothetical protein